MRPYIAYRDAVINGPSKGTRKIACEEPYYVFWYAREVDRCPRDDTRKATCKDPYYAYWYAKEVDKCFHEDTWAAVQNTIHEEEYKTFINSSMKEEII